MDPAKQVPDQSQPSQYKLKIIELNKLKPQSVPSSPRDSCSYLEPKYQHHHVFENSEYLKRIEKSDQIINYKQKLLHITKNGVFDK